MEWQPTPEDFTDFEVNDRKFNDYQAAKEYRKSLSGDVVFTGIHKESGVRMLFFLRRSSPQIWDAEE